MIKITAPARLHFGLISLSRDSPRVYGGCGLSIWHEPVVVLASRAPGAELQLVGAPGEVDAYLRQMLARCHVSGLRVELVRFPPQHVGLGSKTSCAMATAEAAAIVLGLDTASQAVKRMSGRGGTSGIGVNSYFGGGFVLDGGQRGAGRSQFQPSSSSSGHVPARSVLRLSWPEEWAIYLLRVSGVVGISAARERRFFREHAPLPREQSARAAMALAFELPASIVDRDFDGVRWSLRESRRVGFKARELTLNPASRELLELIDSDDSLAGTMSSFGPTVMACARNGELPGDLFRYANEHSVTVHRVAVSNGRKVERLIDASRDTFAVDQPGHAR